MTRFDCFTSIDLETTGLDPSNSEIIEFGAARYENGELVETFSQLVKPSVKIPEEITRLTGIDDDMLKGAPSANSVFEHFKRFLTESSWVVGHNINFDLGFLKRFLANNESEELARRSLDTAVLARILFPRLPRYSLGSLVADFDIKREKAHRALGDSTAAAGVYLKLIGRLCLLPASSRERIGKMLFGNNEIDLFRRSLEPIIVESSLIRASIATAAGRESEAAAPEYPDNVMGESPPEKYDDYIELDEAAVENHFLPGGVFSRTMARYEYRSMQARMAVGIAHAFNRSEFLVVEAATGVGKSIAYLLPASWWASQNNERVVVSTQTKNLQSQLFYKDIPQILNAVGYKFKAVLLKGRGNYICLYKYHELVAEAETTFNKSDRAALASVMLWAENTKTGDISECGGFNPGSNYYIWSRISCEGSFCLGQTCPCANECFLLRIRREASTAQMIVVNHHLTFADFASGGELIRETGHVIFDEAHNLEKIAALYLGLKFDSRALDSMLGEMYSSRPVQSGFLINLKFGLSKAGYGDGLQEVIDKVIDSIIFLGQASSGFFERLGNDLKSFQLKGDARELRISPENNPCATPEREELILAFGRLYERLDALIRSVREMDKLPRKRETIIRLEAFASDLGGLKDTASNLLFVEDNEYVYWIDIPSTARFSPSISSAPLEVGKLFDQKFYDYLKTAVFTSATMVVKGSFDYFMERLGLNLESKDRTLSLCLDSPFDIDSEVAVISAGYLPSPKHADFEKEAFETLEEILTVGAKKAMVLFTSHRALRNAADYLGQRLESSGVNLFSQQGSYNSERVLYRFKSSRKAVLFGADTFWEGVDLPGELLELLILFKLPFTVPDRPWFKANLERIEADGGSSFAKLSLPDAIVKFRQGFGRLIRTAEDRGCVVILDSRVEKTSFGSYFTRSVRGTKFKSTSAKETAMVIKNWLGR